MANSRRIKAGCVIDQYVEMPKTVHSLLHERSQCQRIEQIALHQRARAATQQVEFCGKLLRLLLRIAIVQHQRSTSLMQAASNGGADAFRTAGNQRDLPFKVIGYICTHAVILPPVK